MSCEDEVLSIRKKLEKMSGDEADQSQALDLLNCLGKLDINLQILTSTRYVDSSWTMSALSFLLLGLG